VNRPPIHVSSLGHLPRVAATLPTYDLLTMLSPVTAGDSSLQALAPQRRLQLVFHEVIEAAPEFIAPSAATVQAILEFGRNRTGEAPMLVHCWAGISRSSAAAYMLACDGNLSHEAAIADELRRRAPFATPNRLMISLADDILGRRGRMVDAIARIGRGTEASEGTPYQLPMSFSS